MSLHLFDMIIIKNSIDIFHEVRVPIFGKNRLHVNSGYYVIIRYSVLNLRRGGSLEVDIFPDFTNHG